MSEQHEAAKDLCINGKNYRRGELIPATVDRDRVLNGLRIGSIRVRRPPPAAPAFAAVSEPKESTKGKKGKD